MSTGRRSPLPYFPLLSHSSVVGRSGWSPSIFRLTEDGTHQETTMALLRQCLQQLRLKLDDWDIPDNTWPERPMKHGEMFVFRRSPGMREQGGMRTPPRADGRMRAVHG